MRAFTVLPLVLFLGTNVPAQSFSATPLMDLGVGTANSAASTYKGFQGGLYEKDSDTVPADHSADGIKLAEKVQPLDANGDPSANGKIVFTSIGMSNAASEFSAFMAQAAGNSSVNHTALVLANGALAGITACMWFPAYGTPACGTQNQYDRVRGEVLAPLGATEEQVQVVWIKEANRKPGVTGCAANGKSACQPLCDPATAGCSNTPTGTEAIRYEQQLGEILRAAKTRWPNLKLAFVSTRIYAGYATVLTNPEPYAYEYGFSAKWAIQAQINQNRGQGIDSIAGDLNYNNGAAPWVAWGPYLWADGPIPRSDGLVWCDGQSSSPCNREIDFKSDGTHPNKTGQAKVAGLLINFFLNSAYSTWFKK